MLDKGCKAEQDAMFAYDESVRREQTAFVDYAADGLDIEKPYSSQVEELERMKKAYTGAMLLLCFMPLAKGVKPNTLLKSAGIYLGCMVFSDVFREDAGSMLKSTFLPCVEDRLDRDRKIGFTVDESEWMSQKKRVEDAKTIDRTVWTPDSAAVMQLAYWKQMYERAEGDKDRLMELQEQYEAKSEALYFDAGQDGVSRVRIENQAVQIAGMLEQKDAESRQCFSMYKRQIEQEQLRRSVQDMCRENARYVGQPDLQMQ